MAKQRRMLEDRQDLLIAYRAYQVALSNFERWPTLSFLETLNNKVRMYINEFTWSEPDEEMITWVQEKLHERT